MKALRLDIALVLLVFIVALAARISAAAPVFAGDLSFHMGDDDDYYRIAIALTEGRGFSVDGVPTAYRMPAFPIFAAGLHLLFGPEPYAPLLVFLVISALIAVGTFILGYALGGRVVALIAGLLIALDGGFILYSYHYMTETLFCLLVLAAMLASWRLRLSQDWRWAVATGLLLAGATLTRANFGPFVALVMLWTIWHGRRRLATAGRNATIVAGLVLALWLPWVVRNYLVFESFIPFTTQAGNAYYGLYNDEVVGGNPDLAYGFWIWRIPQPPDLPGIEWNEAELDRYQREVASEWISANPGKALTVALMQPLYLWMPDGQDVVSWLLTVMMGLPALIIFGIRRRQPELVLWLGLALTMSALAVISVGVPRYHIPLRPILSVTTVIFFSGLARELVQVRRRRPTNLAAHTD